MRRTLRALAVATSLVLLAASCAFYNTYYLSKKYYDRATGGLPYPVEKATGASVQNYNKAIDYAKKVIASYPKSKWVDDAYLMWARGLLGKDDPLETINMLRDFSSRYPNSPLKAEATFYLGVAYRQARKYPAALRELDAFLAQAPRHALTPYAHLERARTLTALERPAEAAEAAGHILQRFPKSRLADPARIARAEARFTEGDYDAARADFATLGQRSRTDEERFGCLLREADCLEAARRFDDELALLRNALSHERPPAPAPTVGVPPAGGDRYGRLTVRIGTVHLLAGRQEEGLAAYQRVLTDFPKTPVAAEAQYRIGYAYETYADDFDRARGEYAKVKDQFGASAFAGQAGQRLSSLDRLAQYRTAGGDTLEKRGEAGLMLAEQYLFQLNKPERALEEYRKLADSLAGTPWAGKAMNAQAWVLRRKLDRGAEADSLLWRVVREYPATEAQLGARDYLDARGIEVPASLIKLPAPKPAPVDTVKLTPVPAAPAFGSLPRPSVVPDSLAGGIPHGPMPPGLLHGPQGGPGARLPGTAPGDTALRFLTPAETFRQAPAVRDSARDAPAAADTAGHLPAPADTVRHAPATADSSGRRH